MARLDRSRRVGCVFVNVWVRQKYSTLEVDFIKCIEQGLDTLGLAREVVKVLYDRVISRSDAWLKVLLYYPHVREWLREFIERGEVLFPDGYNDKGIPLLIFQNPRVWIVVSGYRVSLRAEKHVIEEVASEVEKLIEAKLLPSNR